MNWKAPVFFGTILLLCFALTIIAHQRSKKIKINELQIDLNAQNQGFLTNEIVNKLLIQSQDSLFSQQKDMVDLNKIESYFLKNTVIKNAEIYVIPQGKLFVRLCERKAIIRVYGEDSYYLDSSATRFPLSKSFTPEVPIFFGTLRSDEQKKLVSLLSVFQADESLEKEVVHLWKEEENFVVGLRSFSFDVVWGKHDNERIKLEKLKRFCTYLQAQPDKSIDRIDLRFNNQVVAQHNEAIWKNKK